LPTEAPEAVSARPQRRIRGTVAGQPRPHRADLPGVDTAIQLDGVRVRRGDIEVLQDVTAGITRGAVTGLLGPSGSGKTTLMRALLGVQRRVSGRVVVLGQPAGAAALRGKIGYLTQAPSVYRDLTVGENLAYFARLLGVGHDDIAQVLERVGLGPHRHHLAGRLSGGEQTRLSLATALLGSPPLVVLDEPTVGLDPVLRRDLWAFFGELARGGATLLVSSHVMEDAESCDDLLLLRDGRLIFHGSPDQLLGQSGATTMGAAFLQIIEGVRSGSGAA